MTMTVSVIIASFNSAEFVRDAVESALSLPVGDKEVIVVDGGSTDGTVDVLKTYDGRLLWISEPDKGETDALRKGLLRAQGDIVNFLNSDDVLEPTSLARSLAAFERDPKLAMVFGDVLRCSPDWQSVLSRKKPVEMCCEYLLNEDPDLVTQPAAYFRRSAVVEAGGWNPRFDFVSDLDLWIRVMRSCRTLYIPDVFAKVRIHSGQKSKRNILPLYLESFRCRRLHGARLLSAANRRSVIRVSRAYARRLLSARG